MTCGRRLLPIRPPRPEAMAIGDRRPDFEEPRGGPANQVLLDTLPQRPRSLAVGKEPADRLHAVPAVRPLNSSPASGPWSERVVSPPRGRQGEVEVFGRRGPSLHRPRQPRPPGDALAEIALDPQPEEDPGHAPSRPEPPLCEGLSAPGDQQFLIDPSPCPRTDEPEIRRGARLASIQASPGLMTLLVQPIERRSDTWSYGVRDL